MKRTWPKLALLWLVIGASGCLRAVQHEQGALVGKMRFTPPPEWSVTRNYRYLGSHNVVLRSPNGQASLSIQLLPLERRAQAVPLDLLGETLLGNAGRRLGIETTLTTQHEVVVANRRGFAFTGWRRHGPNQTDLTALVSRTESHTLLVTLSTPRQTVSEYAGVMQLVMESIEVPDQPAPPARLDSW